jgi:iron complex outermembrane receptor protein
MGDRNTDIARLQLRWLATEDLTVDLSADYSRAREESAPMSILAVAPAAGLTGIPFLTTFNGVVAPRLPFVAPNGLKTLNGSYVTNDPDTSYATGPNTENLDFWGASGTVAWHPGAVEVKNILAFRKQDSTFGRDGDGSPYVYRENRFNSFQQQLSEELQFNGNIGRLKWIAGLYYFYEKGSDNGFLDVGTGSPIVVSTTNDILVRNKSYAAYGQATYALTDTLGVTLGARINKDKKFLHVRNVNLANVVIDDTKRGSWTSATPMARLQYQPSRDMLFYASYSRGFKSGGFNARPITPTDVTKFNPEKAGSFELGSKTTWFDRRLTANLAAFLVNYTDIQESVIQTPRTFIANAAKARVKGFEAEFVAKPQEYVDLNLAVGYTDAKFTRLGQGLSAGQVLPVTKDTKFVKAPKWSVNGGVQVMQPLGSVGRLFWRADASYFSSYYNDVPNTPQLKQGSYVVGNASLTFEAASKPWQLSAWVKNIGDKRYLVSGNSSSAVGLIEATYSEPRTWGVTATYDFR